MLVRLGLENFERLIDCLAQAIDLDVLGTPDMPVIVEEIATITGHRPQPPGKSAKYTYGIRSSF
jgi:hypothetical protein